MIPRKALITGRSGQDGVFLARELERAGRHVLGLGRMAVTDPEILAVDYADRDALRAVLEDYRPDEIYHLACPSQLEDSEIFEREVLRLSTDCVLTFLRWIVERSPSTRFFFAGSSEIYGDPIRSPQDENCPPRPNHPYALAKLAGQNLAAAFREEKSVFACTGILYNHESHLRRPDFVSRRITMGVARIAAGRTDRLEMGNLDACRDWSHAEDFARGFRLALEAASPADYVFASGRKRTVRDFCDVAFQAAGLRAEDHVITESSRYREDFALPRLGDPQRAERVLGWRAERSFEDWVSEMVRIDVEAMKGGMSLPPEPKNPPHQTSRIPS